MRLPSIPGQNLRFGAKYALEATLLSHFLSVINLTLWLVLLCPAFSAWAPIFSAALVLLVLRPAAAAKRDFFVLDPLCPDYRALLGEIDARLMSSSYGFRTRSLEIRPLYAANGRYASISLYLDAARSSLRIEEGGNACERKLSVRARPLLPVPIAIHACPATLSFKKRGNDVFLCLEKPPVRQIFPANAAYILWMAYCLVLGAAFLFAGEFFPEKGGGFALARLFALCVLPPLVVRLSYFRGVALSFLRENALFASDLWRRFFG